MYLYKYTRIFKRYRKMAEQKKRPSWVEHNKEPGEFPPGFRPEPGTFVPPKDGPKPPKVPPHFVKHMPKDNYCDDVDHFMADHQIQNIPQLIAYIKGQLRIPHNLRGTSGQPNLGHHKRHSPIYPEILL